MEKEHKILLFRLGGTIVLFLCGLLLPLDNISWLRIVFYALAFVLCGYDVVIEAFEKIFHGEFFEEEFLMTLASVGAFVIGEYPEGVFIMFLYQIGEFLSDITADKSKDSIKALLELKPEITHVVRDGEIVDIKTEEVQIGDIILIKPGEEISLDGTIIEGETSINTSAVTGESMPKDVKVGDIVASGCTNKSGVIKVKVEKTYENSTIVKIIEMVEKAQEQKTNHEKFITKFAKIYTPIVVGISLLVFLIPSVLIWTSVINGNWSTWLYRAITILVVSCPCALVVSIPLSYFGGLGAASKNGILFKGTNYIDVLCKTKKVVFDKTGTLTKGNFVVSKINNVLNMDCLEYASHIEYYSNHPIAISIKNAYENLIDQSKVSEIKEIPGKGMSGMYNGQLVYVGNEKLMKDYVEGFENKSSDVGTVVYVAVDGKYIGYIVISDEIKSETKQSIEKLKLSGIEETIMLTGDSDVVAKDVANSVGIDRYYSQLLPEDKVNKIKEIKESSNGYVAFVGDGINDAPVIANSDVGFAMGSLGSDAAIEASDVVIMDDNIGKISDAIKISKKTKSIAMQNMIFSISVKVAILILGAIGIAPIWLAVFGDVGVLILVTLNATRALRYKAK